jgi:hypothetical protein
MSRTALLTHALVLAMLALRERTGDRTYSHTVKQGLFQLVRVTESKRGATTVAPLSKYQDAAAHLALIESIK